MSKRTTAQFQRKYISFFVIFFVYVSSHFQSHLKCTRILNKISIIIIIVQTMKKKLHAAFIARSCFIVLTQTASHFRVMYNKHFNIRRNQMNPISDWMQWTMFNTLLFTHFFVIYSFLFIFWFGGKQIKQTTRKKIAQNTRTSKTNKNHQESEMLYKIYRNVIEMRLFPFVV